MIPVAEREPSPEMLKDLKQDLGGLVPPMTPAIACIYAKMLSIGCPPIRAVLYVYPALIETQKGRDVAKLTATRWMHDVLVLDAINNINGGAFHELDQQTRFRLALTKHLAEKAFYLYTTNFNDVENREGLDKMKMAAESMKIELGGKPDDDDPMAAFMRFAIDLAKNTAAQQGARGKKPPQLKGPLGEMDELPDLPM